jgi:hypothetical protein
MVGGNGEKLWATLNEPDPSPVGSADIELHLQIVTGSRLCS